MENLMNTIVAWLDARIDDRIAAKLGEAKPELELTDAQITDITDAVLRRIEMDGAFDDSISDAVREVIENRVTVNIDFY